MTLNSAGENQHQVEEDGQKCSDEPHPWPKFFLEKDEDPWEALRKKNMEIDAMVPGLRSKIGQSFILIGIALLLIIFLKAIGAI
jgi:hypothetical protein